MKLFSLITLGSSVDGSLSRSSKSGCVESIPVSKIAIIAPSPVRPASINPFAPTCALDG